MCGITGRINFNKTDIILHSELKAMSDSIQHRGPDDEGFYINENIGLGFRRLSIIDLSTGHQPLTNEDESIWIIFNGEIYNFLELRNSLIKQGHIFKTKTDTETIIHLYEQYGSDCLQYLRGMFAFAIWDNNKQELFCARDRFGIKPFYYYTDNKKFVFGSEIKAIVKSSNIDKTLSLDAIDSYFAFGYISGDLSIYKQVKKLQPAHYLQVSLNRTPKIKITRYWDIHFEPDYSKTESQWKAELEECFSETVKMHMISDVPLGAFLSGGIDSSSVVAMMAKNSTQAIKTFSIGFNEQEYNELTYAREIAAKYGCDHHELIVEPESISLLPKLISSFDEPFADSSAIPTYYVSKLARESVKVVLSGDGGDELFAGYSIYKGLNKIHSYPFNFNSSVLSNLIWGTIHKITPQHFKYEQTLYFLSKKKEYLSAYISIWKKHERMKLFRNTEIIDRASSSESYKEHLLKLGANLDYITNMQNLDMKTYMVDDILTKVDRTSMINSIEARVPILDHKFAELSFKIPWNLKLKEGDQKYIFKQAMTPNLTPNILNHRKQGFGIPLKYWFKDDLKQYTKDTLLSANPQISNFLDKKYIQKILLKNHSNNRDFSSKIWTMIVFEEWLKQNQ